MVESFIQMGTSMMGTGKMINEGIGVLFIDGDKYEGDEG